MSAHRLAAETARGHQGDSDTAVEGSATGPDGKARPGQFIFVYRDEGMIGRPEAVTSTGAAGTFRLALPGGGKYYFRARSRYGGPRQPGEWVITGVRPQVAGKDPGAPATTANPHASH